MTTLTVDRRYLTPPTGVIVVFADIWCSFAHIAIHRLHVTRQRLGLTDRVVLELRAFPLELLNEAPSPRPGTDSEVARMAALEPDAGWQLWQAKDWTYPSTMMPALEAVQAAKEQGLRASEALDRALRRAFWAESRNVSYLKTILDVAQRTPEVDADGLAAALGDGRARAALTRQAEIAATDTVACSPHLVLPDGSDSANPGIRSGWSGGYGVGWPVVEHDDPTVYEDLLRRAAGQDAAYLLTQPARTNST